MIRLEGIHLRATTIEELHKTARKFLISKSWYHSEPYSYYDILCPFTLESIRDYIKKQEQLEKERQERKKNNKKN